MDEKVLLRIREIIDKEDKKNPLTDEEISHMLNVRRDAVTLLRKKANIPDSRKRRIPLLKKELAYLLKNNPSISNRDVTYRLQEKGFNVSRFTILNLRKELEAFSSKQINNSQIPGKNMNKNHPLSFSGIVGVQESLKNAILQAQAAVLYPPRGLHTLLFGPSGVGKSRMAETMYHFAKEKKRLGDDAPFIVFNCADYAKNSHLLMAQLFGYVKGAFTGAENEKVGLVDKANDGILFLDEIHRLSPEGQENLFYLIDKGLYRRLGETDFDRRANILLIGATTEHPESSLLLTLRRRIPMTIELPSLSEWKEKERLDLIFHFFHEETNRICKEVEVDREVISALLSYDCPGNAGQLHSDIRVSFAKGFLQYMSQDEEDKVVINRHDLPPHIAALFPFRESAASSSLLKKDYYSFLPGEYHMQTEITEWEKKVPQLYDWIKERYRNLQEQEKKKELVQLIVSKELDSRLEDILGESYGKTDGGHQQLIKIVGEKIVSVVEQMLWIANKYVKLNYHQIFYVLAIHIKGIIGRLEEGNLFGRKNMYNSNDNHYLFETKIAREMCEVIETTWSITLPEEEVGLIAMYINQALFPANTINHTKIGVVIASYGQIARSMADVANRLLHVNHAIAVELHWDDKIEQAISRIGTALQKADEGNGVLLLGDMGTLFLREKDWLEKFNIKVTILAPVSTPLVVEVLRKCVYTDLSLEQIAAAMKRQKEASLSSPYIDNSKRPAVISVCLTGEGAARNIEKVMKERFGSEDEGLTYLLGTSLSIRSQFEEWNEKYDIIATIGTVDPLLGGIPFISMKEVIDGTGFTFIERLLKIRGYSVYEQKKAKGLGLSDLCSSSLMLEEKARLTKKEIIEKLGALLIEQGYVKDTFLQKVWEREELGPTYINDMFAIPHADLSQTLKPAIAIAKLHYPVKWTDEVHVSYVFMMALNENCQPAIEELYTCVMDKEKWHSSFLC
ncbi:sigma 54-interacting transcriptional regulator [Aneurinibacillus terranovensis]|uniref:sigma 54-interacting transcriptional regulator n=1 Tax=Aneurinibacillus terranovensis TaxID=278991 RepID=UPI000687AAD5|nr:sigma 54-interacting transcriptional regulator [Aneurinibacillus terranovensis]